MFNIPEFNEFLSNSWLTQAETEDLLAKFASNYRRQRENRGYFKNDLDNVLVDGQLCLDQWTGNVWAMNRKGNPFKFPEPTDDSSLQISPTVMVGSYALRIDQFLMLDDDADRAWQLELSLAKALSVLDMNIAQAESAFLEHVLGVKKADLGDHIVKHVDEQLRPGKRFVYMPPRFTFQSTPESIVASAVTSILYVLFEKDAREWWALK